MGIAAYNRGTRYLRDSISRKLVAARPMDVEIINNINALPRGSRAIWEPTVVRMGKSEWWMMNREKDGWASFGYRYRTLRELFSVWNAYVVSYGQDKCSFFYRVVPPHPRSADQCP